MSENNEKQIIDFPYWIIGDWKMNSMLKQIFWSAATLVVIATPLVVATYWNYKTFWE